MRGQWTKHTADPQGELLSLLRKEGGTANMPYLYHKGAWGIRTQTIKALIRKGKIVCNGSDIWRDQLTIACPQSEQPTTAKH